MAAWESVTFNSGSGTTITGNYPATVDSGDLIFFFISQDSGSSDTISTPSGFTLLHGTTSTNGLFYVFQDDAVDGTEDSGTQDFTSTGSSGWHIGCARVSAGTYDTDADLNISSGGGTTIDSPSITLAESNSVVLSMICDTSPGAGWLPTVPTGMTKGGDSFGQFTVGISVAYEESVASGATGVLQWDDTIAFSGRAAVTIGISSSSPAAPGIEVFRYFPGETF